MCQIYSNTRSASLPRLLPSLLLTNQPKASDMWEHQSALSCVKSFFEGGGDEDRKPIRVMGCSCRKTLILFQKLVFQPFLANRPALFSLIGLFAVGGRQAPTAAQSAEEAGLLRLLVVHAGDGAVPARRRKLHPEEPLSREQPRPHHQLCLPGSPAARRRSAGAW